MNTNIIYAFRVATVLSVAFFAFTSSALAAPELTPVTVTRVTETSATLIGHVANPYKNSTVWFEFYNTNGNPTTYAVQSIWNNGTFEWNLRDLNPGQTYSYRSAAMEGGVTVYSQTSSFTTPTPKPVTTVTSTMTPPVQTVTPAKTTTTEKEVVVKTAIVVKKEVATTTPTEGFDNNSASIIGAGSGMLPNTLVGWILLLILILAAVLLSHMIYDSAEKRKEEREKKKREEEMKKIAE